MPNGNCAIVSVVVPVLLSVIATIAVVNRLSHLLTVLVKEYPESIVLASLVSGDIDVQVECLTGRY